VDGLELAYLAFWDNNGDIGFKAEQTFGWIRGARMEEVDKLIGWLEEWKQLNSSTINI